MTRGTSGSWNRDARGGPMKLRVSWLDLKLDYSDEAAYHLREVVIETPSSTPRETAGEQRDPADRRPPLRPEHPATWCSPSPGACWNAW